jgi:hypothetical protein
MNQNSPTPPNDHPAEPSYKLRRRLSLPTECCQTCRFIESRLNYYTSAPASVGFSCAIRAHHLAPHAMGCRSYEREPGADDEPEA